MMWAFTGSKTALESIAACNLSALTGMIERIRAQRPHRIDGELIDALDLRFFQTAQCTGAQDTKTLATIPSDLPIRWRRRRS
jgi:hypothetical protein